MLARSGRFVFTATMSALADAPQKYDPTKEWQVFDDMTILRLQRRSLAEMIAKKQAELRDVELEMTVVGERMTQLENTFGIDIL